MPRLRRSWVPGAGAHTISRFIDRRFALVRDTDRRRALKSIELAHDRWDWVWVSYALMSSHLHYGHIAGAIDPDRFFRSAHTRLAQELHRCSENETLGPVFADRPTVHSVPTELLPRLVAYHHRNPVEAGVVERPSQSRWTSHRAYLRLEPAPPWLDVERALDILGFCDSAAGRERFDEFVIEFDLDERSWSRLPERAATRVTRADASEVQWARLTEFARDIASVPASVPLHSKNRAASRARFLVAAVATTDLGHPATAVARKLGIRPGSLYNLLSRGHAAGELAPALAALRRSLANHEND